MRSAPPPVHLSQPLVEALRATYAAAGASKTHVELLQEVASGQGVGSWDALPERKPSNWLKRKLCGAGWRRDFVVHLDELLFDLRMNSLCVGMDPDFGPQGRAPVRISDSWARRGVLLVGPHGKGATGAIEHYACQQVARGAGLLMLSAYANEGTPKLLEKVARATGRTDFRHLRMDERSLPAFQHLPFDSATRYVSLPWAKETAPQDALRLIQSLLSSPVKPSDESALAWPLMLVVDSGALLSDAWLPLLDNARSLGVLLVIRLTSLAEVDHLSPNTREALFNLSTQLFLAPNTPEALEASAGLLELGQPEELKAQTRRRLSELGLGDALMRQWRGRPRPVRLCMVMAYSRQEAEARRWRSPVAGGQAAKAV